MKISPYLDTTVKQDFSKVKAKKVNFMIKIHLLENLEKLIPPGKRSEVVNEALEDWLVQVSREKAYEWTMAIRDKIKIKKDSKSIVELLREDRKGGHTPDRLFLQNKKCKN